MNEDLSYVAASSTFMFSRYICILYYIWVYVNFWIRMWRLIKSKKVSATNCYSRAHGRAGSGNLWYALEFLINKIVVFRMIDGTVAPKEYGGRLGMSIVIKFIKCSIEYNLCFRKWPTDTKPEKITINKRI